MAKLVVNRYANALFELALESGNIEKFEEEVKLVLLTITAEKDFLTVLNHPQVTTEEKFSILETAFKGKISDDIMGLFFIAMKKNREADIVDILDNFVKKADEYKGVVTAFVSSATKLSDEQITSIREKLSQNLNKQINIQSTVDPSLIGGVCINVAGHVIDGSIKKQLGDLKKQLINVHLA